MPSYEWQHGDRFLLVECVSKGSVCNFIIRLSANVWYEGQSGTLCNKQTLPGEACEAERIKVCLCFGTVEHYL